MSRGPSGGRRRILVATRSRHKLDELRALLTLPGTDLVSLDDVGIEDEAVEDASTFRGNAILKARFYAARSTLPTLADDSGLEVDALDGAPGVRTRRYAGPDPTDAENNAKLLAALDGLPPERRTARYRCVLAYVDPGDVSPDRAQRHRLPAVVTRSGRFEGRIAAAPRGAGGFGYDPIFEPAGEPAGGRTVGQMSSEEKNRVSHRAKAARAMSRYLHARGGWEPRDST
ncbi:MAG: XTP/dITP diphosphohydrolase [Chloroflexota bacterium]|jgi:XTP/dITP diphosphohydrolase|nr:XTP/dITP diphosphohydrolase [Chloroflexota bacterium]